MFKYNYEIQLNFEFLTGTDYSRNVTYEFESFYFSDRHTNADIIIKQGFVVNILKLIAKSNDSTGYL